MWGQSLERFSNLLKITELVNLQIWDWNSGISNSECPNWITMIQFIKLFFNNLQAKFMLSNSKENTGLPWWLRQ